MKIEININDIQQFKNELTKLYNRTEDIMKLSSQRAMLLLHREISRLTPEDTGNLRIHWVIENKINQNGNTYELTLTNNIDYGWYVNYGHRLRNGKWWEGFHFVETGEHYARDNMSNIIKSSIEKYLRQIDGVD